MNHNIFNDEDVAKYFAGDLEEKKIEMMEKHLLNDKDKEQEMRDLARVWEKASEIGKFDEVDIDSDWQKVRSRMGFESKVRSISFIQVLYAVAAVTVLVIGIAVVMKMYQRHNGQEIFDKGLIQYASNNAQKEVVLPDSTIIFMNKNASIVYNADYGKTNRDVALTGEAFFNVHKNKNLPFKVLTEGSTIEVLGTSFNIKPVEGTITVGVVEGHVAFYETGKKDNRVDLVKDQQSAFKSKEKIFEHPKTLDPNIMAWRTHKLKLNNYNAKEAFDAVSEYFGFQPSIDPQLNFTETGLTGNINVSSLESAINDLRDVIVSEQFQAYPENNKLNVIRKK
jgi:transmembrane sensor